MPEQTRKVNCKTCDISFQKSISQIKRTPNNFCSRSCAAKHNNVGKQRNKAKIFKCINCNSDYNRTKNHRYVQFCSGCKSKTEVIKLLTIGEYRQKLSVKGKHPSWVSAHVRSFNRSWNKELLKLPCAFCGYSKHVELAHKKSISSFTDNSTLAEVNSKSNIIQLCPNCHWEYDNNKL